MKKLLFILFASLLLQCSNKDKYTDSCCEAETIYTIPDEEFNVSIEEQTTGLLFYKTAKKKDPYCHEPELDNKFWIIQIGGSYI